MSERSSTCGTSSERIEKAPKIMVYWALQPEIDEKCGLDTRQNKTPVHEEGQGEQGEATIKPFPVTIYQ